jgi:hypothetical protein
LDSIFDHLDQEENPMTKPKKKLTVRFAGKVSADGPVCRRVACEEARRALAEQEQKCDSALNSAIAERDAAVAERNRVGAELALSIHQEKGWKAMSDVLKSAHDELDRRIIAAVTILGSLALPTREEKEALAALTGCDQKPATP